MSKTARGIRVSLALLVIGSAAGCSSQDAAQGPLAETSPSGGPPALAAALPVSGGAGARQPACTLAWRAHGHTTQAEAKAFAARCLTPADGAVDERLTPALVSAKLSSLLPSNHELTSVVPRDIASFCPAYASQGPADRAIFWRALLTAIVKPESNYQTATAYWEDGRQQQYSLGLLQLSYNDNAGYSCGFTTEAQVTNPDRNLACGIRIVSKLVRRDGRIGGDGDNTSGAAAYWSTLRSSSRARAEIIGITAELPVCQAS